MASALARAHIEVERRLRELTATQVGRIWKGLPAYDRANVDQWLSEVLPLIDAAQRSSASLTDAYLARSLDRQPLGMNYGEVTGAAVRNGASPVDVYERPFVTLWAALGKGADFESASGSALARAAGMARWDVQGAMRATANLVGNEDDGIFGFERVADAGACAFCQEVDGAYVKSADAMALHNGCGCGLEPMTEPHRGAVHLPDGTRVRDAQYGPLVAVHDHGEMGATLTAADHDFTSEADLAHA